MDPIPERGTIYADSMRVQFRHRRRIRSDNRDPASLSFDDGKSEPFCVSASGKNVNRAIPVCQFFIRHHTRVVMILIYDAYPVSDSQVFRENFQVLPSFLMYSRVNRENHIRMIRVEFSERQEHLRGCLAYRIVVRGINPYNELILS